jgi:hypothetical protein
MRGSTRSLYNESDDTTLNVGWLKAVSRARALQRLSSIIDATVNRQAWNQPMRKLFVVLGSLLTLWVSWGLYRFLSPGWANMSTHDKLYGILFYLGYWSPAAAIIFAGLLYDRNRSRGSVGAYMVISLVCAVVGYALGAALGIAWACSSQSSGNLCAVIGIITVGPFASALAIVLVAGVWRKAGPRSMLG